MLLVVLGHISMFRTGFMEGFPPFALPLFMIVSGYVTNPEKVKIKKRLKLFVPFLVFGLAYSYMCYNADALGFITDLCKSGYWFLWEIIIFNFFIWVISKLKINVWAGLGCIELISLFLYFVLLRHTLIGDILGLYYWCFLFPFFCLGVFMNNIGMKKMSICSNWTYLLCIVMLVSLVYAMQVWKDNYWPFQILQMFSSVPICIMLLVGLYQIENKVRRISFVGKKQIKYIGTQIGQYTLEIYVLHYFVLYYAHVYILRPYIARGSNIEEWVLGCVMSFVISFVCIIIAKLCKKAKLGFLFGK